MKIYEKENLSNVNQSIALIGNRIVLAIRSMGKAIMILLESYMFIFVHGFRRRREIGRQMFICGIKSIFIVAIVAFFTGMILALQAGIILKDYSQEVNIGLLVSKTLCRSMGPFMTALIIAASIGSAIAAEIGTMTVSEEISALQVMSINPASYLVMPRAVALIFMVPALTIWANCLGIIGGMVVGKTQIGVDYLAYYKNALSGLENKEIFVGLLQALFFSQIIVAVSCFQGFFTTNGAIGVGKATRETVVICFLLILISGYFITRIFY